MQEAVSRPPDAGGIIVGDGVPASGPRSGGTQCWAPEEAGHRAATFRSWEDGVVSRGSQVEGRVLSLSLQPPWLMQKLLSLLRGKAISKTVLATGSEEG